VALEEAAATAEGDPRRRAQLEAHLLELRVVLVETLIEIQSPASLEEVAARVISDCHFAVQLNHFIPGFRSYSVAVFLK
jgi:hypothetical protein